MQEVLEQSGWLLKRGEAYIDPEEAMYGGNKRDSTSPKHGVEPNTPSPANGGEKRSFFGATAFETGQMALQKTKAKLSELKTIGSSEKRRFFRLTTLHPTGGMKRDERHPKALLKYYSREKSDAASLKGTIVLNDEAEVSLVPNDTVIKLVVPGRTYYLRPEGDRTSALTRATAARWVQAIDTEIRRMWVVTSMTSMKIKNLPALMAEGNNNASSSSPGKPPRFVINKALSTPTIVEEEITGLPDTLEQAMKDPRYKIKFQQFCVSALASENIEFLQSLEIYDKMREGPQKNQECQSIIAKFIAQDSPSQINISSEQRNTIVAALKKCSKDTVPKGIFDDSKDEVLKLLEKNFFKRFLLDMVKKTGAFAALFGLLGLDGWNAVVSHFGSVLTDQERITSGLQTRLNKAEAQLKATIESSTTIPEVATIKEPSVALALRRTYTSQMVRMGALNLFVDEMKDQVVGPMKGLSFKVQTDLVRIVKGVQEPATNLETIRKLLAQAHAREKRAKEALEAAAAGGGTGDGSNKNVTGTEKRNSFTRQMKNNVKGALKAVKSQMLEGKSNRDAGGTVNLATGGTAQNDEEFSLEDELRLAQQEITDCEKAEEVLELATSELFEDAMNKLESLELFRLETTKKLLRHAAIAEQELYHNLKRVVDELDSSTKKIDPELDLKSVAASLQQTLKPA